MKRHPTPPGSAPGTLTSLLDEVFRGSGDEQSAWVEGLSAGTTLGRYDLIREIGRGGAGVPAWALGGGIEIFSAAAVNNFGRMN